MQVPARLDSESASHEPVASFAPSWLMNGWRPYAFVAIVALIAHVQVLTFDWAYLDDDALILENADFLSDPANIATAFQQNMFASRPADVKTYYRPLVIISYLLNFQVGGTSPFVYQLTNLLLHVAASLLLLRLLLRLGVAGLPATIAVGVFAANLFSPAVVAWIPGRNDSLLLVFALPAMLAYVRFVDTGRMGAVVASVAAFGAALFTKEAAVVLAPLMLGYRFWSPAGRARGMRLSSGDFVAWGGQLAFLVLWYAVRSSIVDPMSPVFMLRSIAANVHQVVPYLGKTVLPLGLSTYPLGRDQAFWPGSIVVVLLLVLVVATLREAGKSSHDRGRSVFLLLFGAAWFAAFLLPTFVLAEPWDDALFFEHRMYAPFAGLLILVASSRPVAHAARSASRFAGVGVLVTGVFVGITIFHGRDFRSPEALWENAVDTSPSSAVAHMFHGIQLGKAGDATAASEAFERASELDSDLPLLAYNAGFAAFQQERFEEAVALFHEEAERDPAHVDSRFLAGRAYLKLERPSQAVGAFQAALAIDAEHAGSLEYLAMVFCRLNRSEEARGYVDRLRASGHSLSAEAQRVLAGCIDE